MEAPQQIAVAHAPPKETGGGMPFCVLFANTSCQSTWAVTFIGTAKVTLTAVGAAWVGSVALSFKSAISWAENLP